MSTLGHDTAAAFLGVDAEDKRMCILCRYDQGRATQAEVIERLGV